MIDYSFYYSNVQHAILLEDNDSSFDKMFFSIKSIIGRFLSDSSNKKKLFLVEENKKTLVLKLIIESILFLSIDYLLNICINTED